MAGQIGTASIYQHIPAGQTDVLINNGESCIIHQVIITPNALATAGIATFEEAASAIVIFSMASGVNASVPLDNEWLADQGLQVSTDANCNVTVWHGHTR